MTRTAGIDVGSSTTKCVVLADRDEAGFAVVSSGADFPGAARRALARALEAAGLDRSGLDRITATGLGRATVEEADDRRTEIACHALGVHRHRPGPHTVVDVGGQDNKVIRVGAEGQVLDFAMNRKCAAGTGAFLEEAAHRLGVDLADLDGLARASDEEVVLGSFCTVFAVTEMLRRIREGASVASLARGAFRSVARRVVEMGSFAGPVVLSGGVAAHNPVFADLFAEETGCPVQVCPGAQRAGALGAALHARRRVIAGRGESSPAGP